MAEAMEHGPDLSPWDADLAARVQPVLSALFHDIMGPLTLVKNRVYLIRRHVQALQNDAMLDEAVRAKIGLIATLLDVVDEAAHRIHCGMTVPRDAIWESVLEGTEFSPEEVIRLIGMAMKGNECPDVSPGLSGAVAIDARGSA